MNNIQQWIMLIAAVAAAIVSIINAWRGQKTARGLAAVDQKVTALALASQPFRGAEPPGSIGIPTVLRYWDLIQTVISLWATFKGMKAGQTAPVPEVKTKVDGHNYRLFGAQVERLD